MLVILVLWVPEVLAQPSDEKVELKTEQPPFLLGYALTILGVILCVFSVVRPSRRSFEIKD